MKPVVLYAEDDENDALLCQRAFENSRLPIDLRIVRDGAWVIGWLAGIADYSDRSKFPIPSVIITDSKMPLKGGLDVLKWVRGHAQFAHIPVVLHYGSIFVQDLAAFDKLRVSACIEKHSNYSELIRVAAEMLRNPNTPFPKLEETELNAFQQRTSACL
jgi:CheY-like chemotaxis protein